MGTLLQQLDLTSEQSQQIEAIREQSRTENDTLYQEMQANRSQMRSHRASPWARSLFTDDASSEQLRQQHQKIPDLSQQLGDRRFEMMLQVREVLTPEQRTQMATLMSQYQGRRGN
ncbi:P pilus assembly/Cpx signaling pathway, periplasmic inhibitor/zinc-resistance associated protein (fragment) [Hyella patelloides LEGE 07179]|uniref:P pilus assembly/Cpx signaling pathway, periplasmic inhibitor/zinc-resistance associated protein n=1 Tax=Hyella patelloides LEGE 07179 TaxID=945734 RepID=A0A563VNK0_9CYAN